MYRILDVHSEEELFYVMQRWAEERSIVLPFRELDQPGASPTMPGVEQQQQQCTSAVPSDLVGLSQV